ncbi:MAG: TonB-dependent receptor [Prevotella sp.]|nr:TonB-dependent receptor [Prevotella sp.]
MSVKFKSIFQTALIMCLLLVVGNLSAQTTAKGTVTDSNGEPVIGATVVEKGNAKNAAVTDFDGNFTLKLQKSKTVVISYIGMVTQEVTAGPDMKIQLLDDNAALDEVVVVGYTSKARKDLTGSVGSVSGAKLATVPVASAAEAMQGKIAGVQVSTVDGAPGADILIRVRGGSALGQNNKPLYIVDGFQADNINDIPPTDIQSIDVLKDASLTAIYGARGGNGVVIVTTKSAQAGKIKVDFNAYGQFSKLAGKQEMLDAYEFVRYQQDKSIGSNSRIANFRYNYGNPQDLDIYKSATSHDWQDELMGGTAWTQMYNVAVTGGNDKLRFSTSLTHHNQNGIIEGTGVSRTNMNTKIMAQLSDRIKLTINPRLSYRRDKGSGGDGIGKDGIVGILRYKPTNGIREFTTNPYVFDTVNEKLYWEKTSPLDDINQHYTSKNSYNFTNQASLSWEIIDNLVFKTDFGLGLYFTDTNNYYGSATTEAAKTGFGNKPYATITNTRRTKYTWTNTLNYSFTLNDDHNIALLVGHEMQHDQTTTNQQGSRQFTEAFDLNPEKVFDSMGQGIPYLSSSSKNTPNRMLSFFGQANYNYKHKYLLSLTMRADGSTKFAPGHQWGYFPSVSGAWVVSEEPWWNKNIASQFKVRAAFGLAGNNDIGDDRWRYVYTINSNGGPSWNETTENGEKYYSVGTAFPNEEIKWETTITRNLALDLGFFKNRLTITPEFYWNTTRDLLYTSYIATTSGFGQQTRNIGKVTNKGFEVTVNYNIFQKKDFTLDANFTMGYNKSKVDQLNGEDNALWSTSNRWKSSYDDFCLKVGDEVGLIYGFVYDGVYGFDEFTRTTGYNYEPIPQVFDENGKLISGTVTGLSATGGTAPGRIKFKDLNGDGKIDELDRTVIGNTNPKLQGGFGLSGNWKDFDFNANFVYFLDFDVLNATAFNLSSAVGASENNPKNVLSDFDYAHRWVYFGDTYTLDADGNQVLYYKNEPLLADSQHPEYLELYEQINGTRSLWNPQDVTSNVTHSYFIEDGSFLRLQSLTLGYTLPKKLTKKWGIDRLRFYFTGSNLFTITNYSGYDPEVDIQNGLTPSVDYNRYPRSRSYLLGVNLSF